MDLNYMLIQFFFSFLKGLLKRYNPKGKFAITPEIK
jgi:hypothetical protein